MDIELPSKASGESSPQRADPQQSVSDQASEPANPELPIEVEDGSWCPEEEKKGYSYWITAQMSHHPIKVCGFMFSFILIIVMIVAAAGLADISTQSQYDWGIPNSYESKNNDALTDAVDRVDLLGDVSGVRRQPYDFQFFYVFTSRDGTDLYTPDNLLNMCETEGLLAQDAKFPDFCQLDSDGECILPQSSIVVYFYEFQNISDWNCTLLNSSVVDEKKSVIYDALDSTEGLEQYGLWLSKDSLENGYSTQAESVWIFGAPLAGYETPTDRSDDQFAEYTELLTTFGAVGGVEEKLFEHFDISTNADNFLAYYPSPYMSKAEEGGVETQWYSLMNANNETTRVVGADLLFASFSILFVIFWLRMHTKSTFIACMGMFMIFCSLPFSIFFYKLVYGIPFFTELHSLVLFIVLGVGADDVFVLVDSWKDACVMYPGDVTNGANRDLTHRRLFHTFNHTLSTVFNTSFTTAMAFMATGFSPLMPIATFGWFAATCIVANYLFVITLMPPVVVINALYCCNGYIPGTASSNAQGTPAALPQDEVTIEIELGTPAAAAVEGDSCTLGDDSAPSHKALTNGTHEQLPTQDGDPTAGLDPADGADDDTEKIMNEKRPMVDAYVAVMTTDVEVPVLDRSIKAVAWVVCLGLFAFGIVGASFGTQLEPPTEQEQWLPAQHMFTLIQDTILGGFLGFDEASFEQVTLTMGVAGIDRKGFDRFKPSVNRGDAIFDSAWDLSSASCQTAMMKMCDDIETWPCGASGCSGGVLARTNTTECFMRSFHTWAEDTYGEDTLSMSSDTFYTRLTDFRENTTQSNNFGSWQDQIGFIDGELKFGSIFFTSTMQQSVSFADKLDVERNIESFIAHVNAYPECDSCDCDNLRFTSPYSFAWMRSEIGLVNGFYQGLSIAFPVAFFVLIFATGNIYITLLAIISVAFIVFGVLGFVNYSLGWSLGVAESIAGIIIIGFSVDYTVHLGHMFTEGEEAGLHTRELKFKYASKKMVTTVIGGAITTIGAGVFMFACQMQFFVKMAVLIVGTIVLSCMYSLGFFMSTLVLVGPEREQGDLRPYFRQIMAWAEKMLDSGKDKTNV